MKKRFLNILLIFIIAAIVLYLVLRDNVEEIILLILKANLIWIFVGLLFVVSYSILKGYIIKQLAFKFEEKYSLKKGIKLQVITNFFNAATPFSSGGQPFQVYMLKRDGFSLTNATSVIISESIIHQIALVVMGIISLIINSIFKFSSSNIIVLVIIGLLANSFVLMVLSFISFAKGAEKFLLKIGVNILNKIHIIKNKDKVSEKWNQTVTNFNEALKLLFKNKKQTLKYLFINTIALIMLYLVPLPIAFSLGYYHAFNIFEVIILANFVALIGSFVPLPGGSGGQEYAFLLLFGLYISGPVVATMMLIWRFITYYLPMIIGAILLGIDQERISSK